MPKATGPGSMTPTDEADESGVTDGLMNVNRVAEFMFPYYVRNAYLHGWWIGERRRVVVQEKQ